MLAKPQFEAETSPLKPNAHVRKPSLEPLAVGYRES